MSKPVDEIIREALERGEFNNLSNKGKKLDLDEYFSTPEDLRVGFSVLKSGEFLPEEVVLLKEIGFLQEKLAGISAEEERKKLQREIEDRRLKYNLLMERYRHHRRV